MTPPRGRLVRNLLRVTSRPLFSAGGSKNQSKSAAADEAPQYPVLTPEELREQELTLGKGVFGLIAATAARDLGRLRREWFCCLTCAIRQGGLFVFAAGAGVVFGTVQMIASATGREFLPANPTEAERRP